MAYSRNVIVKQAQAWIGCNEADGTHKKIIDIYNAHKPLAVGYKVKCKANGDSVNDAWCSTFVSAVAIKCGYTDIIPTECGCGRHIDLFKKKGIWKESDAYVPKAGDIIFYDWSDNGVGENTDGADHVGIVEKVSGSKITVIEGNYSNAVKRRTLEVNGRYIRGYGVPKYDEAEKTTTKKTSTKKATTTKGIDVSAWQGDNIDFKKVKKDGYDFVIIRVGYGKVKTQKDKYFESNYKKAKAAGLKVGVYHYSYAKNAEEAKIEASVCLGWLKGKTLELPVYIDMEENDVARLGKKTCTAIATAFCDAVKAKGYKVGVYSNLNWFRNYLDYDALKAKYSIWFAQYYTTHEMDCDIWQNSSTGRVNGVSGNVDTNYCYVDFGKATTTEKKPTTKPTTSKTSKLTVDGVWGVETTKKAQKVFGTTVDGKVSNQYKKYADKNKGLLATTFEWETSPDKTGSQLIKAIQKKVGATVDGFIGTETIKAMQKWLKTTVDGFVSNPSEMVKAFQKWLNAQ